MSNKSDANPKDNELTTQNTRTVPIHGDFRQT
jgi:hypothetical protein